MKNETLQTIQVNLPEGLVDQLEVVAKIKGVTISWILRLILRNPKRFAVGKVKRPRKFLIPHKPFSLCIHESKTILFGSLRAQGYEFGPYLRYLIELYLPILDELDYDSVRYVKRFKRSRLIKNRSLSIYPIEVTRFQREEFRPKNRLNNLSLMARGRGNRTWFK